MYDNDNVTYRLGINWFDILVKIILLIVFIVILLVLFPKPDLDVFYDSIYTNNINTMKDAAKSYYTVDRLPSTVGESTSMSLKEMVDNHMLIRFKDKDEKYCDETNSGVEVTKTSNDSYVLKVNLNCGEQKDFILETIGCTTVCSNGTCTVVTNNGGSSNVANNSATNTGATVEDDENYGGDVKFNSTSTKDVYTTTVTLYQHKKPVTTTSTIYTCPEGYVRNGTTCTRSTTGATIDATPIYGADKQIITNAKYNDGYRQKVYTDYIKQRTGYDYSCPSGYTLNGSYCIKYTSANVNYGSTTYTCPTGYTKSGTKCVKTYTATYAGGNTSYTCPNGGTLNGTTCTLTTSASSTGGYTCPSGYTQNGTSCYKVYQATSSTSYSCPNGGTLNGTKCVTTSSSSYNATANTSYGSWYVTGTKYYASTISVYTNNTSKVVFNGAVSGAVCGSPCGNKGIWYKYTYYARSANTTYSCPNGGSLSGTKCYKSSSSSYNATPSTSYSCPNGGTRNGSNCTITATATNNTSYSCPSGYTRNGSTCIKTYSATANTGYGYYTCPNGGTLSGNKCTITTNATASSGSVYYSCPYGYTLSGKTCNKKIAADKEAVYEYYCPAGYTQSGYGKNTKCYNYIRTHGNYYCDDVNAVLSGTKCIKTVRGDITGYTCPYGYSQNGSKCTKYTNDVVNATATTSTNTSYKYTWSEKSYLEGWTATGKTKTKTNTYTAGQK